MAVSIGVLRETGDGERRVGLVPDVVSRLVAAGNTISIESMAGSAAGFPDHLYAEAGATIATKDKIIENSDVLVFVRRPATDVLDALTPGQVIIGLLDPRATDGAIDALAARGVRPLSLELLPRQLSRAQTMDALTSQASIAGYRAAVLAAATFERYFPMMITAAGTAKPATVLVLGAGVAGLQAIGTARRLGAQVTGYDVRPEAQEEITSLGASFLKTKISSSNEGGYARALTEEEAAEQQAELAAKIAEFDIVITTAQVPGRTPPLLVTDDTVGQMKPGSVLIDLAASDLGGNVAGSVPGDTVRTASGVTILGAPNLPAQMANAASSAYSRNISAVLETIIIDGEIALNPEDEVVDALWTRDRDAEAEATEPTPADEDGNAAAEELQGAAQS